YYLITHGDLTGFSTEEIEAIASIARYHKGKGPKGSHENWKRLDPYLRPVVEKLAALLRIADGLDHSHRQLVSDVACRVRGRRGRGVAWRGRGRGRGLAPPGGAACGGEPEPARRKSDLFERVFGRDAAFRAVPAGRDETVVQGVLDPITAEALWG